MDAVGLRPVDDVDVTIVIDNYLDVPVVSF